MFPKTMELDLCFLRCEGVVGTIIGIFESKEAVRQLKKLAIKAQGLQFRPPKTHIKFW